MNREAGCEVSDTKDIPTLGEPLGRGTESPIEGDGPGITGHEIVSHIEGGKATAEAVIGEIHQIAEGGRVVQSLGESVGDQERDISGFALGGNLESIVVRVGAVAGISI